jgi:hypothetical protein
MFVTVGWASLLLAAAAHAQGNCMTNSVVVPAPPDSSHGTNVPVRGVITPSKSPIPSRSTRSSRRSFTQQGPRQGDFFYASIHNRIQIRGFTGTGDKVTIPDKISDLPVTRIGQSAFADCPSLTEVTIPASVRTIEDGAFSNCINLRKVKISTGVTSIGMKVFYGCEDFTEITIPATVSYIDEQAFSDCRGLAAIHVDPANPHFSSVDGVLFDKAKTTLIVCPPGKTGHVSIPPGVIHIEARAFRGCRHLNDITIPPSVTHIGDNAFQDCPELPTALRVEEIVAKSGDYSYSINAIGKAAITGFNTNYAGTLIITNTLDGRLVASIKDAAFRGCVGLTDVTIPSTVNSIGYGAFERCTNLTRITIPSSVTSIRGGAFRDCSSLAKVTIPSSVTHIGRYAFFRCRNLTSVAIPVGVRRLTPRVFNECSNLQDITIPAAVTVIGEGAFYGCKSLREVTIPSEVTEIEANAFSSCNGLAAIRVDAANSNYSSVDGVLFNKDLSALIQYPSGRVGGFAIPSGITTIKPDMFRGRKGLTSVTIPNSVTSISIFAFEGCTSLTNVIIPSSVTNINPNAFYGCTGLTNAFFNPYKGRSSRTTRRSTESVSPESRRADRAQTITRLKAMLQNTSDPSAQERLQNMITLLERANAQEAAGNQPEASSNRNPAASPAPAPSAKLPAVERTTAMRDESGRWKIVFPNGHAMDMQSYVERHGGLQDTIKHVRERMQIDTNPERLEYYQQQLKALKEMAREAPSSQPGTTPTPPPSPAHPSPSK